MSLQAELETSARPQHPVSHGATIYYWSRGLLMLANTLVLDRPTSPLTATLRLGCKAPYDLEVEGRKLRTRASLVAPRSGRRRITAVDSDIALFYFPLEMTEYAGLKEFLHGEAVIDLPFEPFEHMLPALREAMAGRLPGSIAKDLFQQAVHATTGKLARPADPLDPRIEKARQLVDQLPLNEVRIDRLAAQVHLSESRLRELFKLQVGATIGEYSRWQAIWRAANLWRSGRKLTDVAVEAGFHDLAHADKVFIDTFGIPPSVIADPRFFKLVQCQ
ncbi:MAG: AraC family transcriptional regulator [Stagnimonas sp.]|nr:AraC family transcriptional regulator [Stagnimonas sp.]